MCAGHYQHTVRGETSDRYNIVSAETDEVDRYKTEVQELDSSQVYAEDFW